AETGLFYLPARYYDPATYRFLSQDPAAPSAGDPLSLNAYAYCLGDPVGASDPSGAIMVEGGGGGWTPEDIERGVPALKLWNLGRHHANAYLAKLKQGAAYRRWAAARDEDRARKEYGSAMAHMRTDEHLRGPDDEAAEFDDDLEQAQDVLAGVSAGFGVASTGCWIMAGVTSETVFGGLTFAGLALWAGGISMAATGVSAVITEYRHSTGFIDRNQRLATQTLNGLSLGATACGAGGLAAGMSVLSSNASVAGAALEWAD
ncbi:MAG: RHS repeat-associated core domain-containing protein, partial [Coriobacteriia bacterium]